MRTPFEFEVNGIRYSSNQYRGNRALILFAKLLKILGPSILGMLTASTKTPKGRKPEDLDKMQIVATLLSSVTEIFTQIDPEEFPKLANEILEGTLIFIDGINEQANVDKHFGGRIGDLFLVMRKLIFFQFANFLELIGVSTQDMTPSQPLQSPSVRAL